MSMKAQEVATVCFSFVVSVVGCSLTSSFFLWFLRLWCAKPFSLDQHVDGLTRGCSDPLVSFVHETVLGSDRGRVN